MPSASRLFENAIFFIAGCLAMPMIAFVLITVLVYAVLMTFGLIGPANCIKGKKRRLGGLKLASVNQNIL